MFIFIHNNNTCILLWYLLGFSNKIDSSIRCEEFSNNFDINIHRVLKQYYIVQFEIVKNFDVNIQHRIYKNVSFENRSITISQKKKLN